MVPFESITSPFFPLSTVDATQKVNAKLFIDGLTADGTTAIGEALQTAVSLLPTTHSCPEIIILISDGRNNTGIDPIDPDPISGLLSRLKNRGIIVHTFGVGHTGEVNTSLLETLATETGGTFFLLGDTEDVFDEETHPPTAVILERGIASEDTMNDLLNLRLLNIFTQLSVRTQGIGIIANETNDIAPGETIVVSVFVDSQTTEATFILNRANPQFDLDLTLLKPDSTRITSDDANGESITFVRNTIFQIFRIIDPERGEWKLLISNRPSNSKISFEAFALSDATNTGLSVVLNKGNVIAPEPILVTAQPFTFDVPVDGAVITGTVTRPDNSQVPIKLLDNGRDADFRANDGLYSAFFSNYNENGNYNFKIRAVNENGRLAKGETIDGIPDKRIPDPFTRIKSVDAIVRGVGTGNFLLAVDSRSSKLYKVDLNASSPTAIQLGIIIDAATSQRVKEIEAMALDSETGHILVISNYKKGKLYKINSAQILTPSQSGQILAEFIGFTVADQTSTKEIECIAIHPVTGDLFGVETDRKDKLVKIDKNTGTFIIIGSGLGDFNDVEGMAFTLTNSPTLCGTNTKQDGLSQLITIDTATGIGIAVHTTNTIGFHQVECLEFAPDGRLFGFSETDIGEDPEGKSDTPVLRVHIRKNATILADLPQEVDGIPIRQVYGNYKLQQASKNK